MDVSFGVQYIKPRVRGRLDKRMLEIATVGLYGHDGEWLNYLATKVCKPGPFETRK